MIFNSYSFPEMCVFVPDYLSLIQALNLRELTEEMFRFT